MTELIALDLDGTLLDPSSEITPEVKDAIAQARSQGVRVVIATGRSGVEAAHFADQAGCDTMAVALGGAALVDTTNCRQVRTWPIYPESAEAALEACLGREIELMIFAGDQIVLDPFSKASQLKTFPCEVYHRAAVVTEDPAAYIREHQLPLLKIHGDHNPAAYPLKELGALEGLELTSSSDHDFEVLRLGVNKGRPLALLGMLYGVAVENCAAIGDSENDLAMLRAVGMPIAMGNACQSVKEAAKYITADNAHNGAAQAILHILEENRIEKENQPVFHIKRAKKF